MTRGSFQELANAVLEGAATPEQRAALEARLASDPTAREQWRSLEIAFEALVSTRPVASPPGLKTQVLAALRDERARRGTRAWTGTGLGRALWPRVASAFAAGCAAGILVWTLVTGTRGTTGGLPASGALMPPAGSIRALDRTTLDAGTARATIETRGGPSTLQARVDAHSSGAAELTLELDPGLEPEALDPMVSKPWRVSFAPGRVTLEFSGDLRCTIRLHGTSAGQRSIRAVVRSGNGTAEGVLEGR